MASKENFIARMHGLTSNDPERVEAMRSAIDRLQASAVQLHDATQAWSLPHQEILRHDGLSVPVRGEIDFQAVQTSVQVFALGRVLTFKPAAVSHELGRCGWFDVLGVPYLAHVGFDANDGVKLYRKASTMPEGGFSAEDFDEEIFFSLLNDLR